MGDTKGLEIKDLDDALTCAETSIGEITINKDSFFDLAVIGYTLRIIDSAS